MFWIFFFVVKVLLFVIVELTGFCWYTNKYKNDLHIVYFVRPHRYDVGFIQLLYDHDDGGCERSEHQKKHLKSRDGLTGTLFQPS